MTHVRPDRFGPSWRQPKSQPFDIEETLVFCGCGVQMQFQWPRGREDVRCLGCGTRFTRPSHYPVRSRLIWDSQAKPTPAWRRWLTPARGLILALCVLAAILLVLGIGLL